MLHCFFIQFQFDPATGLEGITRDQMYQSQLKSTTNCLLLCFRSCLISKDRLFLIGWKQMDNWMNLWNN